MQYFRPTIVGIFKKNSIKCKCYFTEKIYAYGSKEPLKLAGGFKAKVSFNNKVIDIVNFLVLEGEGEPILGTDTLTKLGILKIEPEINNLVKDDSTAEIVDRYKSLFKGIGKLKDFQLKIPIDSSIEPVCQTARRVPYHLRDKLSQKLKELKKLDIIEKTTGPTHWVSPVIVVPKSDGDIRLCFDIRRANLAVKRERHPIPTIEELLQEMNQSKIFSKLDVKWAHHQIELDPESRDITTFATHEGFRYKRLMFGVSCAPEMYKRTMQQTLAGCKGVRNILDDIIVFASSEKEHNERLEEVLKKLKEKGLKLNKEKCCFNMIKLEFMGHVLSKDGVAPEESKIKLVASAREPKNASEVRSFLRLVNYCGRFIPDLATISEPLRKLTRKSTMFTRGESEEESFQTLKQKLCDAPVLNYFDKTCHTQVIADASPYGLAAVLVQKQNNQNRIIAYESRTLSQIERKYSQTEKEALALVWSCERFHLYLYGADFDLLTDHKALEFIFSPRSKPSARIER